MAKEKVLAKEQVDQLTNDNANLVKELERMKAKEKADMASKNMNMNFEIQMQEMKEINSKDQLEQDPPEEDGVVQKPKEADQLKQRNQDDPPKEDGVVQKQKEDNQKRVSLVEISFHLII